MGYGEGQVRDLQATIQAADCDTVILGTPSDITHVIDLGGKPSVIARYELELDPIHREQFHAKLDSFFDRFGDHHHHPVVA